jgi:CelD/BcsL family acetyltransferase involved in cellulose biosynthesis
VLDGGIASQERAVAPLHEIDPLDDPRWAGFVERHPRSSVYHTAGWLAALKRSYEYAPIAFATVAPGGGLRSAIVCCRVRSLLTGRRLISLPFSDHCEPLVTEADDLRHILSALSRRSAVERWKHIEIRARSTNLAQCAPGFAESERFYLHTLDLRRDLSEIYRACHKNHVQRMLRRSQRTGLTHEEGASAALLDKFYGLFVMTRRRHHLPPPPRDWFRNLAECLAGRLTIHVASKGGQPVASIVTLRHGHTLVYKYGCSDPQFHSLGSVGQLLWRAIEGAKHSGLQEFDFGRSDRDNVGLVAFKDHWGAVRSDLIYLRYPTSASRRANSYGRRLAHHVIPRIPDGVLKLAGAVLYRHIG